MHHNFQKTPILPLLKRRFMRSIWIMKAPM